MVRHQPRAAERLDPVEGGRRRHPVDQAGRDRGDRRGERLRQDDPRPVGHPPPGADGRAVAVRGPGHHASSREGVDLAPAKGADDPAGSLLERESRVQRLSDHRGAAHHPRVQGSRRATRGGVQGPREREIESSGVLRAEVSAHAQRRSAATRCRRPGDDPQPGVHPRGRTRVHARRIRPDFDPETPPQHPGPIPNLVPLHHPRFGDREALLRSDRDHVRRKAGRGGSRRRRPPRAVASVHDGTDEGDP